MANKRLTSPNTLSTIGIALVFIAPLIYIGLTIFSLNAIYSLVGEPPSNTSLTAESQLNTAKAIIVTAQTIAAAAFVTGIVLLGLSVKLKRKQIKQTH